MAGTTDVDEGHAIVLFDGVCNLCNAAVNFLIDRDTGKRLRFAALQSEAGRELLEAHGHPTGDVRSIVLVEDGRTFTESTAALRIARHLRAPWRLLYALVAIPRVLRDPVYRVIARNRYDWFGKQDACRVPTPDLRARFLE